MKTMEKLIFNSKLCCATDFNTFYGTSTNLSVGEDLSAGVGSVTLSGEDVYVYNSMFRECTFGGAINCTSSKRLLIEDSSFISCSTTYAYGGAIYCSSSGLKSILNKLRAFNCSNKFSNSYYYSYGQCFFIQAGSNFDCNNYINHSSIYSSFSSFSNSYYALRVSNGNIKLTKDNITNNGCSYYSALYCSTGQNLVRISYLSFVNNTAKYYGCLQFYSYAEIHYCNIIRNEQNSTTSPSVIQSSVNLFIYDSCILENNLNKMIFKVESNSYRITLTRCTIDSDIFTTTRYVGSLTIGEKNEKDFINGIDHLNTGYCEAFYDSVGTLTPSANNKVIKQGLCVTYIHKSDGTVATALKAMKYIILNSFIPSDKSK